ncbi:aspartate dehydrogenase [Methanothermobacter tenebrarum]|uniref:L-aspartate dehydrogenase n=1 Tax=Methanothermobacter tenebrarum TaxID=680118 RepID=A0A328P9R4_9EURY|nr:aspartate dehydrogenase [Methanothermobacter tenebrarum]MBC7100203.1 aspartate dehydrogenase [Methanobacteriales archaeon]MBC7117373.1 aspartate dehydrogenase [Methanobacteriaceae archaeon]NPV64989.1 aspartate dehydrogenase [Methanobacteriaceae archaeon]RAO79327.1 aspartate dehydrogenase [Methanothermobacter tenebrarum]
MIVGIVGCGAIANIITSYILEEDSNIQLKFFYDRDLEKAENLSSIVDGIAVLKVEDMLDKVDLVIEAASPEAVAEIVPDILKAGKDVLIMSVGALMDKELRSKIENLASKNNANVYIPSGAIVGLDGIKAASIGKITSVKLVTRKPPRSLGISTDEKKVLYKGNASEAVKKFPLNINVAATLSIACNMDVEVEIIVDPQVDRNLHEITVKGDFGELKTIAKNIRCSLNPKTSVLAAYSAIKLLKSLSENFKVGT